MIKKVLKECVKLGVMIIVVMVILAGARCNITWLQCVSGFLCGFCVAEGIESIFHKIGLW